MNLKFAGLVILTVGCGQLGKQKASCRQMLECIDAAGEDITALTADYGQQGSCWDAENGGEVCAAECEAELVQRTLTSDCSQPEPPTYTDACDTSLAFPKTGPLSAGSYAENDDLPCPQYDGGVWMAYFPQPTCSDGNWSYEMETRGWISGGRITAFDSAGGSSDVDDWWVEQHDWKGANSHEAGWWDRFVLDLQVTANASEFRPSQNSLLPCSANDGQTLTWAYEVFDLDDSTTRIDCIVAGSHVDLVMSEHADLVGCETMDAWTPR